MSLRFALLGFLSTTPASGYTLGRKFADGAGAMWEALPSQIYPELGKLEKLGWIHGTTDASDKLNRRVYEVTPEGMMALLKWVGGEEAEHPPERDAERVRFLFLERSSLKTIRVHVMRHRAHYVDRLEKWQEERDTVAAGTHERIIDRLRACKPGERDFIMHMKWFAFEGLVQRAEMEIGWANDILAWLDELGEVKTNSPVPKAWTSIVSKPRSVTAVSAAVAQSSTSQSAKRVRKSTLRKKSTLRSRHR